MARAPAFQAGDAGSIPVTRSRAQVQVSEPRRGKGAISFALLAALYPASIPRDAQAAPDLEHAA